LLSSNELAALPAQKPKLPVIHGTAVSHRDWVAVVCVVLCEADVRSAVINGTDDKLGKFWCDTVWPAGAEAEAEAVTVLPLYPSKTQK
jgi:hypothetical protein